MLTVGRAVRHMSVCAGCHTPVHAVSHGRRPRAVHHNQRGVLRQTGAVYQSRHIELQQGLTTGTQANSKRAHQPHLPQQMNGMRQDKFHRPFESAGSATKFTDAGHHPVTAICQFVITAHLWWSLTRVLKPGCGAIATPREEQRYRGRLPGLRGTNPERIRTLDWLRAPVQRGGLVAGHDGIGKPVRPCARHHGRGHPRGSA